MGLFASKPAMCKKEETLDQCYARVQRQLEDASKAKSLLTGNNFCQVADSLEACVKNAESLASQNVDVRLNLFGSSGMAPGGVCPTEKPLSECLNEYYASKSEEAAEAEEPAEEQVEEEEEAEPTQPPPPPPPPSETEEQEAAQHVRTPRRRRRRKRAYW